MRPTVLRTEMPSSVQRGYPGGVVTAVFEPPQSVEEEQEPPPLYQYIRQCHTWILNRDNCHGSGKMQIPSMSASPVILPVNRTLAVIMGGGAGTRLFPLTKERSKPAVPLGGKYRIVDIPITTASTPGSAAFTCSRSSIRRRCTSTSTRATSSTTSRAVSSRSSPRSRHRRTQLVPGHRGRRPAEPARFPPVPVRILRHPQRRSALPDGFPPGPQAARRDGRGATIATIPVTRTAASDFGIMHTDAERKIIRFVEKPKDPEVLDRLRIPEALLEALGSNDAPSSTRPRWASTSSIANVIGCLDNTHVDFGKNVIPAAIRKYRSWPTSSRATGRTSAPSVPSSRRTSISPTSREVNFNVTGAPVYTHPRFLPASVVRSAQVDKSMISDGCVIEQSVIEHCIIGSSFRHPAGRP